jgi:hypothetical protein
MEAMNVYHTDYSCWLTSWLQPDGACLLLPFQTCDIHNELGKIICCCMFNCRPSYSLCPQTQTSCGVCVGAPSVHITQGFQIFFFCTWRQPEAIDGIRNAEKRKISEKAHWKGMGWVEGGKRVTAWKMDQRVALSIWGATSLAAWNMRV